VGVIPFSPAAAQTQELPASRAGLALPPQKLALLKEYAAQKVIEIGIHGFVHADNRAATGASEFAGLPLERQYQMLRTQRPPWRVPAGSKARLFIPHSTLTTRTPFAPSIRPAIRWLSAGAGGPVLDQGGLAYCPGGPIRRGSSAAIVTASARAHGCPRRVDTASLRLLLEALAAVPEFRREPRNSASRSEAQPDRNQSLDGVRFVDIDRIFAEDLSASGCDPICACTRVRDALSLVPDALNIYALPGLYYSTDSADRLYRSQLLWLRIDYGTSWRWSPHFPEL